MDDASLLLRIIGDPSGGQQALKQVTNSADEAVVKMQEMFGRLGNFIKGTIGVIGVADFLKNSIDEASKLTSVQRVQSQLLTNQGLAQQYAVTGAKDQHDWYSKTLALMSSQVSMQTGISQAQILQGQTYALTNRDVAKVMTQQADAFGQGATYMKAFTEDAANMSAAMGSNGGGVVGASKMLGRVLANPAQKIAGMARYGVTLSMAETLRIKQIQATNGLLAAQKQTMIDINNAVGGAATAAASPMALLKNDISTLESSLGQGIMPIINGLSTALGTVFGPLNADLLAIGPSINNIASALGNTLGAILADLTPVFNYLANDIFPLILSIFTPLMQMVEAVLAPLAKALDKMTAVGAPLTKMFASIGAEIGTALEPAIKALSKAFNEMVNDGALASIENSLMIMLPVLPTVASAFAQLVVALVPLLNAMIPTAVKMFAIFARIIADMTPYVNDVAKAFTSLAQGPFRDVIAGVGILAGVWFTRKLFLTPIEAAVGGVRNLIGVMGRAKSSMSDLLHGGFKSKIGGLFGGTGGVAKLEPLDANTAALNRLTLVLEKMGEVGSVASDIPGGSGIAKEGGMFSRFAESGIGSKLGGVGSKMMGLAGMGGMVAEGGVLAEGGALAGMGTVLLPLLPIIAGIAAAAAAAYLIFKHWRGILTGLKDVFNFLKRAFDDVWGFIKSHWKLLGMILLPPFAPLLIIIETIKDHWRGLWTGMKEVMMPVVHFFEDTWNTQIALVETVVKTIEKSWDGVWGFIEGIGHDIASFAQSIWKPLYDGFVAVANMIIRAYDDTIGWIPGMHVNALHYLGGGTGSPQHHAANARAASSAMMRAHGAAGSGPVMNVHQGAVQINIHGNPDEKTLKVVKSEINKSLTEFHRVLKGRGR